MGLPPVVSVGPGSDSSSWPSWVSFFLEPGERDAELFDVAQPAVPLGGRDPPVQVCLDAGEPGGGVRVNLQEVAAQAGVLVAAAGAVGPDGCR
jgi:hypothetical protein